MGAVSKNEVISNLIFPQVLFDLHSVLTSARLSLLPSFVRASMSACADVFVFVRVFVAFRFWRTIRGVACVGGGGRFQGIGLCFERHVNVKTSRSWAVAHTTSWFLSPFDREEAAAARGGGGGSRERRATL